MPGIGELVAGKYRVERVLGVGGMGAVLSARHEQLGQVVALKVLHPQSCDDQESVSRFTREARLAASLESDHVVRIFDVGTLEEGVPFMVMERLLGEDLGRVLERQGTLPASHAAECVHQAALGVADAHAAGVIHRDLKPSNLFLTRRRDGSACVKVLDFGISKALSEAGEIRLTRTRTVVGSPLYMSPEQVRDSKQVDFRSDVWSLGVILHELLSGRPPFDGETMPAVCARIAADPPPPIERDDLPPALLEVLERCLEKDPALRLGSALELSEALAPFRPEEPLAFALLSDERLALRDSAPRPSRGAFDDAAAAERAAAAPFESGDAPEGAQRWSNPGVGAQTAVSLSADHPSPPLQQSNSVTRTLAVPHRATPWKGRAIAAAVLGLVAAGGLFLHFVVLGPPGTAAAPPATPAEPTSQESASELVTLHIDSTPAGAEVWDAGKQLGHTPLDLRVRRGLAPLHLRLRLEGYAPFDLEEPPLERDRELRVQLIRLAPGDESPGVGSVAPGVTPARSAPDHGASAPRAPDHGASAPRAPAARPSAPRSPTPGVRPAPGLPPKAKPSPEPAVTARDDDQGIRLQR